jgi:diacylglycerol kinase family enzyme
MITPDAAPQSGRFQVVWLWQVSRLQGLSLIPWLYAGRHLNHPQFRAAYAGSVKIMTDPTAYVEAEGEPVGRTPLEAKIFTSAFWLAVKLDK